MIEVERLSKRFVLGHALEGVSFGVKEGQVCGLIGSNGAGKTTLLRILATILPASSGAARICKLDVRKHRGSVRRRIGYMPDTFGGYEELRVDGYLELFAHIFRLPRQEMARTVEDILKLVDLVPLRNHTISRLSLGARQRLALGRVLLHDADVLLLDEPVTGLDPVARIEMRALLRELGRMGKTILISSHILGDLADLCDTLVILERGGVVFEGPLEELRRRAFPDRCLEIQVEGPQEALLEHLQRQSWTKRAEPRGDGVEVSLEDGAIGLSDISTGLFSSGFRLLRFRERSPDLEEIFIRITREAEA